MAYSNVMPVPRILKRAAGTSALLEVSDNPIPRFGRGSGGMMVEIDMNVTNGALVAQDWDERIVKQAVDCTIELDHGFVAQKEKASWIDHVAAMFHAAPYDRFFAAAPNVTNVLAGAAADVSCNILIPFCDPRRETGRATAILADTIRSFVFSAADLAAGQVGTWTVNTWSFTLKSLEVDAMNPAFQVGVPVNYRTLKITDTSQEFPRGLRMTDLLLVGSAAAIAADKASSYSLYRDGVTLVDNVEGEDLTEAANALHDADYYFDDDNVIVLWTQGFGYAIDDVPAVDSLTLENNTGAYHADTRFLIVSELSHNATVRAAVTKLASKIGRGVVGVGLSGDDVLLTSVSARKAPRIPLRLVPPATVQKIVKQTAVQSGRTVSQVLTERRT